MEPAQYSTPQNEKRIDVNEYYDLEYWTHKFGVTPRKLRAVVREVGETVQAIEMRLAKEMAGEHTRQHESQKVYNGAVLAPALHRTLI
jgi:hypothetical protein